MVRSIEIDILAFIGAVATFAIVIAIYDIARQWHKYRQARNQKIADAAFREQLEREAQMHEVAAVLRYRAHEARKAMIREAHRASQHSNDAQS